MALPVLNRFFIQLRLASRKVRNDAKLLNGVERYPESQRFHQRLALVRDLPIQSRRPFSAICLTEEIARVAIALLDRARALFPR